MAKSNQYWEDRLANEYWEAYNDTDKYRRELIELYKAAEEVREEFYKLAAKTEKNGIISRSDIYRGNYLKELEQGFKETLRELGEKVEDGATDTILEAGMKTANITANAMGVMSIYDPKVAVRMLQDPWHGATFSDRVWNNQDKLLKELNSTVRNGIITGRSTSDMAIELDRNMGVGLSNAARLVRTETMHHMNAVNMEYMKRMGVDKVKEVVTLDERTSSECSEHDGMIWDIDKAPTLPRHPNCRCVLVAYIDVDKLADEFDRREAEIRRKNLKTLINSEKNGIIDIEVDKFVSCLEDAKTGKILNTQTHRILIASALKEYNKSSGWYINWEKELELGHEVYALTLEDDDEIQGLISISNRPENKAVEGHWMVANPINRGKDKKYNGVGGHLYAIAGKKSVDYGNGGFFYGKAKNKKLLKHYITHFGATPIGDGYRFYINEESMTDLIEMYNFEEV